MSETLATEVCRDLKRRNVIQSAVIIALSAALALGGLCYAVTRKEPTNTVATNMGR